MRSTDQVLARATGWEIFPLEKSWGADAVGIVGVEVEPEFRRQGIGVLLVTQILRHYRDNGLTLAEVQTMARNQAARKLYHRLGFEEIDRGVVYRAGGRTQ